MDWYKIVTILAYSIGAAVGLVVLYFTWLIQRIKREHVELEKQHAQLEMQIAQKKLEAIQGEAANRLAVLNETASMTTEISERISQKLIENPSWLDRFMDETGVTYSASVYGKRIGHFFYEKRKIAEGAVNRVEEYLRRDGATRYCLVIDSGTTLYPVFQEITERLRGEACGRMWRERVCIVTNNIPGVQYLMKNAKETDNEDYSEIAIKCFVMPGKPLSVYAAITGDESKKWLLNLKEFLNSKEIAGGHKPNEEADGGIKVIGFVTGNYIAREEDSDNKTHYYPVARGEGHLEIKRTMVEVSDEVFVLAPLMKFSFASVDLLNRVNGFDVARTDWERAKQQPRKVKYETVGIPSNKGCVFFTTQRPKNSLFAEFSHGLSVELARRYKPANVIMPEFELRYWNPSIDGNRHIEIQREIPHDNLREQYEKGKDIWDLGWVQNQQPDGA